MQASQAGTCAYLPTHADQPYSGLTDQHWPAPFLSKKDLENLFSNLRQNFGITSYFISAMLLVAELFKVINTVAKYKLVKQKAHLNFNIAIRYLAFPLLVSDSLT